MSCAERENSVIENIDEFFDSKYLSHQFIPSNWGKESPDVCFRNHKARIEKASEDLIGQSKCDLDISYGSACGQKLHIIHPTSKSASNAILVFIHGGYWQEMNPRQYLMTGKGFIDAGFTFVSVGYDLAPTVKVSGIMKQIEECIPFLYGKFPSHKIFISGHSAGGQLASHLCTVDWKCKGLPKDVVTAAISLSGIFDLRYLVPSVINDQLKISRTDAWNASPLKTITSQDEMTSHHPPLLIAIGEFESPEFHQQQKVYKKALFNAHGYNAKFHVISNEDHFTLAENFGAIDTDIFKESMEFIKEHLVCS